MNYKHEIECENEYTESKFIACEAVCLLSICAIAFESHESVKEVSFCFYRLCYQPHSQIPLSSSLLFLQESPGNEFDDCVTCSCITQPLA